MLFIAVVSGLISHLENAIVVRYQEVTQVCLAVVSERKYLAAYQNSWAQGWTARGSKKTNKALIRP